MFNTNPYRYRFYREHKLISFELSELERLIAKSDFRISDETRNIKNRLRLIEDMMNGHAEFEEKAIHILLSQKASTVHLNTEAEHKQHRAHYQELQNHLDAILNIKNPLEQEQWGYDFYVKYRLFVCDNLQHLHHEETVLMPELQRLYTDDELRQVEFNTFNHMTPEQMVRMLDVLGPHMNPSDRAFFINEMKTAEPEKFSQTGLAEH